MNPLRAAAAAALLSLVAGAFPARAQETSADLLTDFGRLLRQGEVQAGQSALLGTLYDLKQDPQRRPTGVDPGDFITIVSEFIRSGWDERVLNRYYRASRPILATHIFIPTIDAGEAPRAFGVEKAVQPSRWVIVYKAEIIPPEDGVYRFVGGSDDYIAIRVNDRLVLSSGRPDCNVATEGFWEREGEAGRQLNGLEIHYGSWVEFRRDRSSSLEILVGERPGGQFDAYVLIQRQGAQYAEDRRGNPVLPVFRVAQAAISTRTTGRTPQVITDAEPWTALQ